MENRSPLVLNAKVIFLKRRVWLRDAEGENF
jgi:hypothetical protein